MCRRLLIATVLLLPIQFSAVQASAAESALEIVNPVASQTEDGPPVARTHRFLPGDTVYFSFQVAHFAVRRNEELDSSQIDLVYEVALEDLKGVPIVRTVSDRIAVPLNSEDKNWLPKRRATFQVPGMLPAGEYRIRLLVKDAFARSESTAAIPFYIGGEEISPSQTLGIQQFRFLRDENDTAPLTVAAYRPGDTVFLRFDIVGFASGKDNQYHVRYGFVVLAPNGKPFVQAETAATMQDTTFYPSEFLPAAFEIVTKPASSRGVYTVVLTVQDLIGNRSADVKQVFTLE